MDKEKLLGTIPALDYTVVGSMGERLSDLAEEHSGDLPDIALARVGLAQTLEEYVNAYGDVESGDVRAPMTHTEFRALRESAQGLIWALNELAQYDNSLAEDAVQLKLEFAPLLRNRAEEHRAVKAAQEASVAQR